MRRALFALLAGGCGFSGHGETNPTLDASTVDVSDAPGIDAAIDAPIVPPDAATCFGAGTFVVCLSQLPTNAFNVNGGSPKAVDTDMTTDCTFVMVNGVSTCVIAATSIAINDRLSAQGSRPLVLVSTGSINVNGSGRIDVAHGGAGANPASCQVGSNPNTSNNRGGGGAGGSFVAAGGAGGKGDGGNANGGTAGGFAIPPFDSLVGGCDGHAGADGVAGTKGAGGKGGGVVYLVAVDTISLNGYIDASGGGGAGGNSSRGGGGGGGSGGMIVFHAGTLTVNGGGKVYANGGGGGGGADNSNGGGDGGVSSTTTLIPSFGTGAGGAGAAGGIGAYGILSPGPGLQNNDGGGGGGGGIGLIRALAGGVPAVNPNVSPPATN